MGVVLQGRRRIFLIGNSGAGKTTLAKVFAERLGRMRIDLDEVAFSDRVGTRRELTDSITLLRDREGFDRAIIEGCYADLIEALAMPDDHLIWLDLSVDDCIANAEARPWEPHKWPSAKAQDAFLPKLLEFIATYPDSSSPTGRPAHAALFEAFVGTKERYLERPTLAA